MADREHAGIAKDLTQLDEHVQSLLRDLEITDLDEMLGQGEAESASERSELHDALGTLIETTAARLLVYTDALNLPFTRGELIEWRGRWGPDQLRKSQVWSSSEADGRESAPYEELRRILDAVMVLVNPSEAPVPDPRHREDLERLTYCLRSLAKVCRERGEKPTSEAGVQRVLHSHLEGVFADYTRTLTIAKPLVSFKPDGGVISLRAAIECKFVDSLAEVRVATHGLTEDLSGYAGSADWVNFYSVIYMTGAFATEGQFQRALGKSGHAGAWTTILVTGEGTRSGAAKAPRKAKLTPSKVRTS